MASINAAISRTKLASSFFSCMSLAGRGGKTIPGLELTGSGMSLFMYMSSNHQWYALLIQIKWFQVVKVNFWYRCHHLIIYPIILIGLFLYEQLLQFETDSVGPHELLDNASCIGFLFLVGDSHIDGFQVTLHRLVQWRNGQLGQPCRLCIALSTLFFNQYRHCTALHLHCTTMINEPTRSLLYITVNSFYSPE